ncbi:MAG: RluA family pseudouridine synthase [Clostridiaceae bacterium]|nr:RluA family pseudouridine synthase [Clostridiaceae bacterium]
MSLKQQLIVSEDLAGTRIDKYLSLACENISRSYLQKLVKSETVLVNQRAVKSNYKVAAGDMIDLEIPEAVEPEIEPEQMDLDILYEDSDIIIINKPKGMVVHPAAGHYTGTLVNGLMDHCRDNLSGINGVLRPGIVHRIDMDTTGVLIVCKNDMAHNSIAAQLKEHSITRKYYAVVHGVIKEEDGTVDAPIGRHPTDRKKMSINHKNGREAVTHYHVLKRYGQFTYVECQLETGRTHQIRVHMASIHHPLLGDQVYGPARCPFQLQGQTLHAGVLGIVHPRSGEYMEFTAPLPEYFQELLLKLEKQ